MNSDTDTITNTTDCEETQEPDLWTVIRNNRFVQLPWAELDSSERRAIYDNIFHPNG